MMKAYPDDKELHRITKQEITLKSRDNARTPMQWDTSAHAGFSTATPWQKENESYNTINAESQVGVKDSVFEYWASILRLRKSHKDIFIYGEFKLLTTGNNDIFAYTRTFGEDKVVVVANFKKEEISHDFQKEIDLKDDGVLISNYGEIQRTDFIAKLRPFEAFACLVK